MKTTNSCKFVSAALIFSIVFINLFSGCKIKKDKETSAADESQTEVTKEEVIFEISGYPLPTSFYLTKMLNDARASYILSISNNPENVDHYFSQKEKALNLGVYGADLSYASTYLMKHETMLFLEASKRLIDEMEISTVFNLNYIERVKNNLGNGDSLILIISDSFYDTYEYLTEHEKDKQAVFILTGSWIEGLYITLQIALTAGDYTKFLEIIAEQESSLEILLDMLGSFENDADISDIYSDLKDVKKIYNTIEQNITIDQFNKLSNSIETLRNKII